MKIFIKILSWFGLILFSLLLLAFFVGSGFGMYAYWKEAKLNYIDCLPYIDNEWCYWHYFPIGYFMNKETK